jgi:hypothetical protein
MGQCITMNVGNHGRVVPEQEEDKSPEPRKKRKRKRRHKEDDSEDEDSEDEGMCGCVEEVAGCLPCL